MLTSLSPRGTLCLFATKAVDVALGLAGVVAGPGPDDAPGTTDLPATIPGASPTEGPTTTAGSTTTLPTSSESLPDATAETSPPATTSPVVSTSTVPVADGPTTTTVSTPTTPPGGSGGCDRFGAATARISITGIVHFPDGVVPNKSRFFDGHMSGLATLRDHATNPGGISGEASVNEAGFFLLNASVPAEPGCPRSYTIEIDIVLPLGTVMYGELDVTALMIPLAPGADIVDADITSTPIQVEITSRPATTTAPPATSTVPPSTAVPTSVDPSDNSGEHDTDEPRPDQPPAAAPAPSTTAG